MKSMPNPLKSIALFLTLVTLSTAIASPKARILQQTPPTGAQIRTKVDAKIQQKVNAVSERYAIISEIMQAQDDAVALKTQLLAAKVDTLSAYRDYYNAKVKCDGYSAASNTIGVKGEISDDVCLESPIASQAQNLYIMKAQLEGYAADTKIAQKINDVQVDFLADASAQLAIYQDLAGFFKSKSNSNLQNKYDTKVNSFTNFYNTEKSIGDAKKQALDNAKFIESSTGQIAQAVESTIKSWRDSCLANVTQLKTALNAKLAAAAAINTQLKAKQAIIDNGWTKSAAKLIQLNQITADMKALADQYSASVGLTA